MGQAASLIDEATSLVNRSCEALEDIFELVQKATAQFQAIATATEKQPSASEEVNRNIDKSVLCCLFPGVLTTHCDF